MDSYTSLAAQLDSPWACWNWRTAIWRRHRSTSKRPWPSPMHSRCRDSAGASAPTRV